MIHDMHAQAAAALLHDGGWRAADADQIQKDFGLDAEKLREIVEELERFEKEEKDTWVISMALPGADKGRYPDLIPRVFTGKSQDLFRVTASPEELEKMLAYNGWAVRGLVWESDDMARFEGAAIHSRFEIRRED